MKKLTPPKDGFDSLLHRITTSLLFLIPNDFENLNNTSLHIIERIIPPKQNPINSIILCITYLNYSNSVTNVAKSKPFWSFSEIIGSSTPHFIFKSGSFHCIVLSEEGE